MRLRAAVWAVLCLVISAPAETGKNPAKTAEGSPYLLLWAGDKERKEQDFVAVIDVRRGSGTYGKVLRRVHVPASGTMPHHTEYEFPASGQLFANGWAAGRTFVIDASEAKRPKLRADFVQAGGYGFPHSFVRLPNGNVLATFQSHGAPYVPPGGLVELDDDGTAVRSGSAVTPALKDEEVWPYSLAVMPDADRVVVTNTAMGMPDWAKTPEGSWPGKRVREINTDQVQIWTLSELKPLHTLSLPPSGKGEHHLLPAEPRVLSDGSVYVNTFLCGLYRVTDIATPKPKVEFVYAFPGKGLAEMCSVPVIVGKYWIQTTAAVPGLIALDISDPAKPVEVSRLQLDHSFHMPHWLAADRLGSRLVLTGHEQSWVLLVDFDPATGQMSLDEKFRQAAAKLPGLSLTCTDTKKTRSQASVHGALFAPR